MTIFAAAILVAAAFVAGGLAGALLRTPAQFEIFNSLFPIATLLMGFFLSKSVDAKSRKRKLHSALGLLFVELSACKAIADAMLGSNVATPSSRFPTSAFSAYFPFLVAESAFNAEELYAIQAAYGFIESLNRGLDNAAAAHAAGNT